MYLEYKKKENYDKAINGVSKEERQFKSIGLWNIVFLSRCDFFQGTKNSSFNDDLSILGNVKYFRFVEYTKTTILATTFEVPIKQSSKVIAELFVI